MYSVYGQHDMPYHAKAHLNMSAFYTLVEAKKIRLLEPGKSVEVPGPYPLRLHGFPWGFPVTPNSRPHDLFIEIAVVHAFIWTKDTGYAGAPADARLKQWADRLRGYDVALFGDNHKPFTKRLRTGTRCCTVHNGGGWVRRRRDEADHRPSIGLVYSDGTVGRHYLDVSGDVFSDAPDEALPAPQADMGDVIRGLDELGDGALDYALAVRRELDRAGAPPGVREAALRCLDRKV